MSLILDEESNKKLAIIEMELADGTLKEWI